MADGKPVLCIPGIGPLDEAFTLIVAQSIERREIGVRAERWDALSVSRVFSLDTDGVELMCLCYLASVTSAQIRYSVRRLRRKVPDAFILVTLAGDYKRRYEHCVPIIQLGSSSFNNRSAKR